MSLVARKYLQAILELPNCVGVAFNYTANLGLGLGCFHDVS